MSIQELVAVAIKDHEPTINGRVASTFYEIMDISGKYVWGCDVDIGEPMTYEDEYGVQQNTTVLQNVPVAMNNREIFYAQVGWPVLLRRISKTGYAIVGLAKSLKLTTEVTYVSFTNGVSIIFEEVLGYYYRTLSLGELGTVEPFGSLPFGVIGMYNLSDDSLIKVRT